MIEFKDVSFAYGDRATLSGVSTRLEPGGFYFLTGPSGAGKSTFLKLCYLALTPTSGKVELFGRDTAHYMADAGDAVAQVRRRFGIVFQDCPFLEHMTVAENIALPLRVAGRPPETYRENLDELIRWVDLEERAKALPAQLSGGERQRAALARAMIGGPEVILADEPTGNVDRDMADRILDLLLALHGSGRTILVVTHDRDLIRMAGHKVSNRVLYLSGGKLREGSA